MIYKLFAYLLMKNNDSYTISVLTMYSDSDVVVVPLGLRRSCVISYPQRSEIIYVVPHFSH